MATNGRESGNNAEVWKNFAPSIPRVSRRASTLDDSKSDNDAEKRDRRALDQQRGSQSTTEADENQTGRGA